MVDSQHMHAERGRMSSLMLKCTKTYVIPKQRVEANYTPDYICTFSAPRKGLTICKLYRSYMYNIILIHKLKNLVSSPQTTFWFTSTLWGKSL